MCAAAIAPLLRIFAPASVNVADSLLKTFAGITVPNGHAKQPVSQDPYVEVRKFFRSYTAGGPPYNKTTNCCLEERQWTLVELDHCELTYRIDIDVTPADGKPNTHESWIFV
jgi:hypothetical protein